MQVRFQELGNEILKFGVIGAMGFVVDVGLFNVLCYAGNPGLLVHQPVTAKAISVTAATILTYIGNRHWTWAHRPRNARHREAVLFFVFSALGLAISVGCLAFSHYVLDLTSPLADNVSANVVGLVLGMVFRFWTYRTFVFVEITGTTPPDRDDVPAAHLT